MAKRKRIKAEQSVSHAKGQPEPQAEVNPSLDDSRNKELEQMNTGIGPEVHPALARFGAHRADSSAVQVEVRRLFFRAEIDPHLQLAGHQARGVGEDPQRVIGEGRSGRKYKSQEPPKRGEFPINSELPHRIRGFQVPVPLFERPGALLRS